MHPATVYIVIAVLTFGIFSGVNLHEFVDYGDQQMIVQNERVRGGLGGGDLAAVFAVEPGVAWQPLAWLSLQAQRDQFGLIVPAPYMLGNVALHIATVMLLLFALARLTARFWPSAFVAAVYAVHPLSVETAVWASARSDALSHFFFVAVLAAWAIYVERPRLARLAVVVCLCALGVLSGGRFGSLPFLLLVLDVWPLGRLGFAGERVGRFADRPEVGVSMLLGEKAPLLLLGLVGAGMRQAAEASVVNTWGSDPGIWVRFELVLVNIFDALGRMFWPDDLAFTAPTALQMGATTIPLWQAAFALLAIAAITFALTRLGSAGRPTLVGWLWFLIATIPVAGLIPSGLRMMNDRYLQIGLIGLALMVAFTAARLLEHSPKREIVGAVIAALVLVPMGAAARVQVHTWRDSDALFDHALSVHDADAMALYYKAMRLAGGGFETAALAQLERAVEIHPAQVHANLALGQLQLQHSEPAAALLSLRRAMLGMPDSVFVRIYVATALMDLDRADEAMATINEAIELEPESAAPMLQRARLEVRLGRSGPALADYGRALELDPSSGVARAEMGRLERALAAGREAP